MILAESVDKEPEIMLGHFSIKGACLLTYLDDRLSVMSGRFCLLKGLMLS